MSVNIVQEIVERRKADIAERGFSFGFEIPSKRTRPVVPFMQEKGAILEVKRASPSKGDIAPGLDSVKTALEYRKNGAKAISCLTEENYFKGSLKDLMAITSAIDDVAVLRKDFLIDEQEIEISYLCGADAVLLICGILSNEKLLSMTAKCHELGIRALVEVRTEDDAEKVLSVKKVYPDTIVCGVNSRNLKDFTIDLLVPAMLKEKLGGSVIFESGITTQECAQMIGRMGFKGILLGEFAARNPQMAGVFVKAFTTTPEDAQGRFYIKLAQKIMEHKKQNPYKPMVKICGLTKKEDIELAVKLGADFTGFILAPGFARNIYGERFQALKESLSSIKNVIKIGVITDPASQEAKFALSLVEQGLLDCLQFHGIKYQALPQEFKNVPHYFALTGKEGISKEEAEKLNSYGYARYLQDSSSHNYAENCGAPLWLAGGVNPQNVRELIDKFHPELVDVSSGLEDVIPEKTGIKNHKKMIDFFSEINKEE